jgi:sugar phosphate isomerase/epimerase
MIRLVCLTLPYSSFPLRRGLEGVARAGYDYVGVGWPHEGVEVLGFDAKGEQVEACLSACEEFGLSPLVVGRGPVGEVDTAQMLSRRVDVASALGAESVQMAGAGGYRRFPSEPLDEETFQAAHRKYVTDVRAAGEHASKVGIVLALKPHTGNTATAKHLARVLPEIGVHSVQACYDPGNVHYYEGVAPAEDFPLIADRTFQIVAKDHRGERAENDFPIPGEGDVDFSRIFSTARQSGFSGPVVVERVNGTGGPLTAEEIDGLILKARTNLTRLLQEAGLI